MCGLKDMYDSSKPLNPCCMVRMDLEGWWRAHEVEHIHPGTQSCTKGSQSDRHSVPRETRVRCFFAGGSIRAEIEWRSYSHDEDRCLDLEAQSGSACSALIIITILMMEVMIIDDAGYDTVLYLQPSTRAKRGKMV